MNPSLGSARRTEAWRERFFAHTGSLSAALSTGSNTLYLFADKDDLAGGTYGFGMNIWLDGAAPGSQNISVFAANGDAGTFMADGTTGCTPDFDGLCAVGSNALSWMRETHTVTLTSFAIIQIGGASAAGTNCIDKVGYANSAVIQNMPNGVCDTIGSFTLTVQ